MGCITQLTLLCFHVFAGVLRKQNPESKMLDSPFVLPEKCMYQYVYTWCPTFAFFV